MTNRLKQFIQEDVPDEKEGNKVSYTLNNERVSEDEFIESLNNKTDINISEATMTINRLSTLEDVRSLLKENISLLNNGTLAIAPKHNTGLEKFDDNGLFEDILTQHSDTNTNLTVEGFSAFKAFATSLFGKSRDQKVSLVLRTTLQGISKTFKKMAQDYSDLYNKNIKELKKNSDLLKQHHNTKSKRRLKITLEPLIVSLGDVDPKNLSFDINQYPQLLEETNTRIKESLNLNDEVSVLVLGGLQKETVFLIDLIDKPYSKESYRKILYDLLERLNEIPKNLKYDLFKSQIKGSSAIKTELENKFRELKRPTYYYYGASTEGKGSLATSALYFSSTGDYVSSDFQPILDGLDYKDANDFITDFIDSWDLFFYEGIDVLETTPVKVLVNGNIQTLAEVSGDITQVYEELELNSNHSLATLLKTNKEFEKFAKIITSHSDRRIRHEDEEVFKLNQTLKKLLNLLLVKQIHILTQLTKNFNTVLLKSLIRENQNLSLLLNQ